MPSLQTAFDAVVNICNRTDVTYSQTYRYMGWSDPSFPEVGDYLGNVAFDCSSLMSYGLASGGFFSDIGYENPWFTTYQMDRPNWSESDGLWMQRLGWVPHAECVGAYGGYMCDNYDLTKDVCRDGNYGRWIPGDILVRWCGYTSPWYASDDVNGWYMVIGGYGTVLEHTEMVYAVQDADNQCGWVAQTMGAHGTSSGVSINTYNADPNAWTMLWRCSDSDLNGGEPFMASNMPWINRSGYYWQYTDQDHSFDTGTDEAVNNAKIVFWYCYNENNNWCRNAIYALLGNMAVSSGMNPKYKAAWNGEYVGDIGLLQWDENELAAKLYVLYSYNAETYFGDNQMNVLFADYFQCCGQRDFGFTEAWYYSDPAQWDGCTDENTPYCSFYDWVHDDTVDIETKTRQFMCYYVRPRSEVSYIDWRIEEANSWADILADYTPEKSASQNTTGGNTGGGTESTEGAISYQRKNLVLPGNIFFRY